MSDNQTAETPTDGTLTREELHAHKRVTHAKHDKLRKQRAKRKNKSRKRAA